MNSAFWTAVFGGALCFAIGAAGCGSDPSRSGRTGGLGASGESGGGASGDSGSSPAGSGSSGGGGNGSKSGSSGGIVITPGEPSDAAACQELNVDFQPKTPTVLVLVDRSSSMFDDKLWDPLKGGVLDVVKNLQADVRFGFTTYSGVSGGDVCPDLSTKVDFAKDNAEAIATAYDAAKDPRVVSGGKKGETPTPAAIEAGRKLLLADDSPGDRFILLVTDGEPDYCDDGAVRCPIDSVVYQLQESKRAGITTFVFGLKAANAQVTDQTLQKMANAGAGKPVADARTIDIWDQCNFNKNWNIDPTLSRDAHPSLGEYVAEVDCTQAGACAQYFTPAATDREKLSEEISRVLSGVKSCSFDLEGKIKVDRSQLNLAKVKVEGEEVPLDETNGWRMTSDTQLELVGAACDNWRKPSSVNIKFEFPCEIIIILR